MTWRAMVCAVALATISATATGCSAAGPIPDPSTPVVTVTAPAGTTSLAALGWKNPPAERIWLPTGVTLTRGVDQANVISAFGAPTDGAKVLATLRQNLPAAGWRITADAGGSLLFEDAQYTAAFTSDSALWALTVRQRASS